MTVSETVRDAYASAAQRYIDRFADRWPEEAGDTAFVERHLTGLAGPVLDLGCGPGHWTARLQAEGTDVTGVDLVPEFLTHARAAHPGVRYRLGSMLELDVADHSVSGVLAWFSTIHLPPEELDEALGAFRRVLASGGVLVAGFFGSDDEVAPFDHAVVRAWRWPLDAFADRLAAAGFVELERRRHPAPGRPDRLHAAMAARAS